MHQEEANDTTVSSPHDEVQERWTVKAEKCIYETRLQIREAIQPSLASIVSWAYFCSYAVTVYSLLQVQKIGCAIRNNER